MGLGVNATASEDILIFERRIKRAEQNRRITLTICATVDDNRV